MQAGGMDPPRSAAREIATHHAPVSEKAKELLAGPLESEKEAEKVISSSKDSTKPEASGEVFQTGIPNPNFEGPRSRLECHLGDYLGGGETNTLSLGSL